MRHNVDSRAASWASRPYTLTTSGSPRASVAWTRNNPACWRSAAPIDGRVDAELGERRPHQLETGPPATGSEQRGERAAAAIVATRSPASGAERRWSRRARRRRPRRRARPPSGRVGASVASGAARPSITAAAGRAMRGEGYHGGGSRRAQTIPEIRPGTGDGASDQQPAGDGEADGEEHVAHDRATTAHDRGDTGAAAPGRPRGRRGPATSRPGTAGSWPGSGRRPREPGRRERSEADRRQRHHGADEQRHVPGPPRAWLVGGGGEQPQVPAEHGRTVGVRSRASAVRSCPRWGSRRRRRGCRGRAARRAVRSRRAGTGRRSLRQGGS